MSFIVLYLRSIQREIQHLRVCSFHSRTSTLPSKLTILQRLPYPLALQIRHWEWRSTIVDEAQVLQGAHLLSLFVCLLFVLFLLVQYDAVATDKCYSYGEGFVVLTPRIKCVYANATTAVFNCNCSGQAGDSSFRRAICRYSIIKSASARINKQREAKSGALCRLGNLDK